MPPPSPDSPEPALARWFAHGFTSHSHPVLRWALETYFHPLGVEAEALEAEPFGALEAGGGAWWLRSPRWNPARFDRRHPAAEDFRAVLSEPDRFAVAVDPLGLMLISLSPAGREDAAAQALWDQGDRGWNAARHAVEAAQEAESFIYAAAGMILANDPAAALYAQGDDLGFCAAVRKNLAAEPATA